MFIYNYITTNTLNGKQYIGMHTSNKIDDGYLGSGKLILQAIKKYRKESFTREILCFCEDTSTAFYKEGLFIQAFNTLTPDGYNLSPAGGLGVPGCFSKETLEKFKKRKINHSERAKQKMSLSKKGKLLSEKHKESLKGKNKGKIHSEKQNKEHSEKMKGKKHTEEWKINNGLRHKGMKRSEETKKNISNALAGKRRTPLTEEHRKKIREGMKNKKSNK